MAKMLTEKPTPFGRSRTFQGRRPLIGTVRHAKPNNPQPDRGRFPRN